MDPCSTAQILSSRPAAFEASSIFATKIEVDIPAAQASMILMIPYLSAGMIACNHARSL